MPGGNRTPACGFGDHRATTTLPAHTSARAVSSLHGQRARRRIQPPSDRRLRGGSRDSNPPIRGPQPRALPIEPQPHRNRRTFFWSRRQESNLRSPHYKCGAQSSGATGLRCVLFSCQKTTPIWRAGRHSKSHPRRYQPRALPLAPPTQLFKNWRARRDLNPQLLGYEPSVLPSRTPGPSWRTRRDLNPRSSP